MLGTSRRHIIFFLLGAFISVAVAYVLWLQHGEQFNAQGPFLTWQQDPTSTMTIDWYTHESEQADTLAYRLLGDDGEWSYTVATEVAIPSNEYEIQRVELTGLEDDATYEFQVPAGTFRFRTLPETLSRPIRFAAGGDVRHRRSWMEETNREAVEYDLDFVIWGGDLAYTEGWWRRPHRWSDFFEAISNTLVREDGRVIPVIVAIGNHEVRGGYYDSSDSGAPTDLERRDRADYFYSLFAFPGQPGYGVLDVGDYLSLVVLDSDHTNPVDGLQTEWLEETLAERQDRPFVVPVYHVPAYPSHRSYDGAISQRIREYWVPLFERYDVPVAFENHDHTYKRTPPIRAGEVDSTGVVYVGDGAWGVFTRRTHAVDDTWYLERAEPVRHFILGTLEQGRIRLEAIDQEGQVFDAFRVEEFRVGRVEGWMLGEGERERARRMEGDHLFVSCLPVLIPDA